MTRQAFSEETARPKDSAEVQLAEIKFHPTKPLIISDLDEVIVSFVVRLEQFLEEHNLYIDLVSYKLFGNIKNKDTNERVDKETVSTLIHEFMRDHSHTCEAVEGAIPALKRLEDHAQIVILSNTPFAVKTKRQAALKAFGLDVPFIANAGNKGPALALLQEKVSAPILFLDDIPDHLDGAYTHAPDIHRIHFVADSRLANLLPPAPRSDARFDNWKEAEAHILYHLKA